MTVFIKLENEIPHVTNRVTVYTETETWTTTEHAYDVYNYVRSKLGKRKDGRTYRNGRLVATDFNTARELALYALEILIRAKWAEIKIDWWWDIDNYRLSEYDKHRNRDLLEK